MNRIDHQSADERLEYAEAALDHANKKIAMQWEVTCTQIDRLAKLATIGLIAGIAGAAFGVAALLLCILA